MKDVMHHKLSAILVAIIIQAFSITTTLAQNSNALLFDGINDRVEIANNPLLNPSHISIQAWVRMDYIGGWPWRCVVTKRNCCGQNLEQWTLQTEVGWLMSFHAQTDGTGISLIDPNPMQAGVWTEYTFTYDGHTSCLYRNGVVTKSDTTFRGNISPQQWPVVIGDRDGGLDWWPGCIDEVRIWDRALSQQEVLTNMNCHLNGNEPGLIAYYDFNQGIAGGNNAGVTTLPDLTSHGLNGSLQNFALSGNNSNWVASSFTDLSVTITSQPTNAILSVGDTAKFIVSTSNNPVSFQWQTDSAGSGFHNIFDGGRYIGTSNDTLFVNAVTLGNNNQLFRCIVSSPGFCAATSAIALLLVTRVLGVSVINFNAVKGDKNISLKWVVENETNISMYTVERGRNGSDFYPIGNMTATNINYRHLYSFTDASPLTGVNFYRLKITEMNGRYYYSAIRKIDFESDGIITVYQNPTNGIIQIITDNPGEFEVGILDMNGRLIHPKERFIGSKQFDLRDIPNGIYLMEIYYFTTGKRITNKLVKMR